MLIADGIDIEVTLIPMAAGNHPENDTNPTAAPTRSANVCLGEW